MCNKHKCIWLCGDSNTRVSRLPDFIPYDHYINGILNVDPNNQTQFNKFTIILVLENLSILLVRICKDTHTNVHGLRFKIGICRNNDLFVPNGRCGQGNPYCRFYSSGHVGHRLCFRKRLSFSIIETDPLFSDGQSALRWSIRIHAPNLTNDLNNTSNTERR